MFQIDTVICVEHRNGGIKKISFIGSFILYKNGISIEMSKKVFDFLFLFGNNGKRSPALRNSNQPSCTEITETSIRIITHIAGFCSYKFRKGTICGFSCLRFALCNLLHIYFQNFLPVIFSSKNLIITCIGVAGLTKCFNLGNDIIELIIAGELHSENHKLIKSNMPQCVYEAKDF